MEGLPTVEALASVLPMASACTLLGVISIQI